jgi:hypothetical protein
MVHVRAKGLLRERWWSAGPKLICNLKRAIIPEIMDAESLLNVFGPSENICHCSSLKIHQAYKIQCVLRVFVRFHASTLSGPHTPGFLFLGVCKANHLQCSYSQHSRLETVNQGSCCIWNS